VPHRPLQGLEPAYVALISADPLNSITRSFLAWDALLVGPSTSAFADS